VVRLGELRLDAPLVVGEGIESTMAASEISGWPGWAGLSAGGVERLVLPAEARDIRIVCDRDRSGIGERSARIAAAQWQGEGRRVRLVIPDRIGADANDLLRELHRVA
jgi:putative DNA primase/helicase